MNRLALLATSAALLAASPAAIDEALSASSEGAFAVRGVGSQPCSELLAAVEGPHGALRGELLASWIAGYLSHANRVTPGAFELVSINDSNIIAQIVLNVCQANSAVLVENALSAFVASMASARQAAESPLVEIRNERFVAVVRASVLRQVQEELVRTGHLAADLVDGAYGPRTRDALMGFQDARRLPRTGVPDAGTIVTLFLAENRRP